MTYFHSTEHFCQKWHTKLIFVGVMVLEKSGFICMFGYIPHDGVK